MEEIQRTPEERLQESGAIIYRYPETTPPPGHNTKAPPEGADAKKEDGPRPLQFKAASLRPGTAIAPREWIYGRRLIRRYLTVVAAPGGIGKTAWSTAVALACASGKALVGDNIHVRCNVLLCSLEDPEDELDRRIAAAMSHHGIHTEDLAGRIWLVNGRERRMVIAKVANDRITVCYPDKKAMTAQIMAHGIGVVVVDPFVNSHEVNENDNGQMNAAARAWAEIANETGAAILLVHHTRKGAVAGDMDSARGAVALIGAARAAFTLAAMTPAEAAGFGIAEQDRRRYIRMDDGKSNLAAPSADRASWYRLASVPLGNGTEAYPAGDNVQALESWKPPSAFDGHTPQAINEVLDAIAEGPTPGVLFAGHRRGSANSRWAGAVLIDMLHVNEEQAAKMLTTWTETGLLVPATFRDPKTRKEVTGIRVDDERRPTI